MLSGAFGGRTALPRRVVVILAKALDFMQIHWFSSPVPHFPLAEIFLLFICTLIDSQRRSGEYKNKTRYVWSLGLILSQASRNACPVPRLLLWVVHSWILQKNGRETPPVASTNGTRIVIIHRVHGGVGPPAKQKPPAWHPRCFDCQCEGPAMGLQS